MPVLETVGAIAQIGATVATTIAQVKDVKLRREFEQNFQLLSLDQKKRLDKEVLAAQTQNERIAIITNAFVNLKVEEQRSKAKKDIQTALIVLGGGVVLLLAIYFVKKA